MNDFTKEELEHMANGICLMMAKCSMRKKYYGEVEKIGHKLQSMIDNYCEHEESEGDNNYEVERCKICGKLFI